MTTTNLFLGDCLDVLKTFDDNSFDSIVTDPPYGLFFMGKKWDYDVPSVEVWLECLRVLKPGGHLLAFAGTRTQHRMAVRIEDAGFEIRDMIAWVYGSGFPKSLDVSKAIDKAAGAEREVIGPNRWANNHPNIRGKAVGQNYGTDLNPNRPVTAPATDAAREWEGWGTSLKPSHEPITVARKPLIGTVAENVLAHGTGGINVDACRVGDEVRFNAPASNEAGGNSLNMSVVGMPQDADGRFVSGRWPSNLIHDGSDEVVGLFPAEIESVAYTTADGRTITTEVDGSAARFFYCAKASKADRDEGLEEFSNATAGQMTGRKDGSAGLNNPRAGAGRIDGGRNHHPTVKPTDLMAYLVTLVTPKGGHVLDPFMGSGSTGKACVQKGFAFTGIERDPDYLNIAQSRIDFEKEKQKNINPLLKLLEE
ncbi:MAG: DNA-methyltransferase [Vampirovibrionales bacterium]